MTFAYCILYIWESLQYWQPSATLSLHILVELITQDCDELINPWDEIQRQLLHIDMYIWRILVKILNFRSIILEIMVKWLISIGYFNPKPKFKTTEIAKSKFFKIIFEAWVKPRMVTLDKDPPTFHLSLLSTNEQFIQSWSQNFREAKQGLINQN